MATVTQRRSSAGRVIACCMLGALGLLTGSSTALAQEKCGTTEHVCQVAWRSGYDAARQKRRGETPARPRNTSTGTPSEAEWEKGWRIGWDFGMNENQLDKGQWGFCFSLTTTKEIFATPIHVFNAPGNLLPKFMTEQQYKRWEEFRHGLYDAARKAAVNAGKQTADSYATCEIYRNTPSEARVQKLSEFKSRGYRIVEVKVDLVAPVAPPPGVSLAITTSPGQTSTPAAVSAAPTPSQLEYQRQQKIASQQAEAQRRALAAQRMLEKAAYENGPVAKQRRACEEKLKADPKASCVITR